MSQISPFFTSPITILQDPRTDGSGYLVGRASVTPQLSPTRTQCSKIEERPGSTIWRLSDSRDTDAFQIFPMEVDKDNNASPKPSKSKAVRDTAFDKDITECSTAPQGVPSTPTFNSGHKRTIASCGRESRDAANHLPDILNKRSVAGRNCPGYANTQTSWKPPKPPKPLFLSDVDVASCENMSPSPVHKSRERKLHLRWSPFSVPQGCARSRLHIANRSMLLQDTKSDIGKHIKSWNSPKIGPLRCPPRLSPQKSPKTYFLKDDPSGPFPVTLSPIDKSPLCQDSKLRKQRAAGVHFQEIDDVFSTHEQERYLKGNSLGGYIQRPLAWGSLRSMTQERGLVTLSLVGRRSVENPFLKCTSYSLYVKVNCSSMPTSMVNQDENKRISIDPSLDTTCLFGVDIIAPVLFLQILARLFLALRSLMSSEAAFIVAMFVQVLSRFIIVPILYILEKLRVKITIRTRDSDTV
ncbi:hypothetical protein BO71DRAFT_388363 [Aspergillus ellipticus CBS 707.79]|uniref:Uncharacterized protein n=1 Tax=Aspergillus ellipticus CBS 707.79 TaxID=1448320 RepID=A0A319CYS4_9EURO|nr:hypothetical protein BO71DRAFT_388363 [Aspergillus ellipticus CBS 707.79]